MKLILLADIEKLGKVGEEVVVRRGYARNYLLPQRYALIATKENMLFFAKKRKQYEEKMEVLRVEANTLKSKIHEQVLTIAVRSGENDKLYGSITTHMIAELLEREYAVPVDRRKILLEAPIRSLGEYTIRVRLHADIVAEFTLCVVSEKSDFSLHEEEVSNTEQNEDVAERSQEEQASSEMLQ